MIWHVSYGLYDMGMYKSYLETIKVSNLIWISNITKNGIKSDSLVGFIVQ